ncbi:MAG: hypothetical protein ACFB21_08420 [Opitutales bacterium]
MAWFVGYRDGEVTYTLTKESHPSGNPKVVSLGYFDVDRVDINLEDNDAREHKGGITRFILSRSSSERFPTPPSSATAFLP